MKKNKHKGKSKGIFGVHWANGGCSPLAKFFVRECCAYIEKEENITEEGIYRKSGELAKIQRLKALVEKGPKHFDLNDPSLEIDVHVVTGLLKGYLREMPEPVIPFNLYAPCIAASGSPEDLRDIMIANVITLLPPPNQTILEIICTHLREVTKRSDLNLMTPKNVAIVFAPNFMRPQKETMDTMIGDAQYAHALTISLINKPWAYFSDDFSLTPSSTSGPRTKGPPTVIPTQSPTKPGSSERAGRQLTPFVELAANPYLNKAPANSRAPRKTPPTVPESSRAPSYSSPSKPVPPTPNSSSSERDKERGPPSRALPSVPSFVPPVGKQALLLQDINAVISSPSSLPRLRPIPKRPPPVPGPSPSASNPIPIQRPSPHTKISSSPSSSPSAKKSLIRPAPPQSSSPSQSTVLSPTSGLPAPRQKRPFPPRPVGKNRRIPSNSTPNSVSAAVATRNAASDASTPAQTSSSRSSSSSLASKSSSKPIPQRTNSPTPSLLSRTSSSSSSSTTPARLGSSLPTSVGVPQPNPSRATLKRRITDYDGKSGPVKQTDLSVENAASNHGARLSKVLTGLEEALRESLTSCGTEVIALKKKQMELEAADKLLKEKIQTFQDDARALPPFVFRVLFLVLLSFNHSTKGRSKFKNKWELVKNRLAEITHSLEVSKAKYRAIRAKLQEMATQRENLSSESRSSYTVRRSTIVTPKDLEAAGITPASASSSNKAVPSRSGSNARSGGRLQILSGSGGAPAPPNRSTMPEASSPASKALDVADQKRALGISRSNSTPARFSNPPPYDVHQFEAAFERLWAGLVNHTGPSLFDDGIRRGAQSRGFWFVNFADPQSVIDTWKDGTGMSIKYIGGGEEAAMVHSHSNVDFSKLVGNYSIKDCVCFMMLCLLPAGNVASSWCSLDSEGRTQQR